MNLPEHTMIYILTSCLDDPRFSGFDGPVVPFKSIPKHNSIDFKVNRLAPGWVPQRVFGSVRPDNHYPCVHLSDPVFSAYAVRCLADLLVPNGELLPVLVPRGEYWFYNLLTIANVLDPERSDIQWLIKPVIAAFIKRYEVIEDQLNGLVIFRIPQKPFSIYVTDVFVREAIRHSLTGMRFTKVWPLKPREKPEIIEVPATPSETPESRVAARSAAMAESVCMDVPCLSSSNDAMGAAYDRFDADLGDALQPMNPGSFAIGHVEYWDLESDFRRYYLSCPNARSLADWLDRFLRDRGIRDLVRITMRFGPYDHVDVPSREVPA